MRPLGAYINEARGLSLENLGSWPGWAHIGAIGIVCSMIVGLSTYYMVLPKRETLGQIAAKETELKADYEKKQARAAQLPAYEQQLDAMQIQFSQMLQQLPSESEVPNLLKEISQKRAGAGLDEQLFKPVPEQTKDFYAVLPIEIQVTGSYSQFADFVSRVAALPRIVTINHVEFIQPDDSADLSISLTAQTYRYLAYAQDEDR